MGTHISLDKLAVRLLENHFTLTKKDIGFDAVMKRKGFKFVTSVYDIEGIGHLCTIGMKAFGGVVKMQTVVICADNKDVPLFNMDWISAGGAETFIAELYDVQLEPYPEEDLIDFQVIRECDSDLKDKENDEPRWYDDVIYPCSYHKHGRLATNRFTDASIKYLRTMIAKLEGTADCDPSQKIEKRREFAERLLSEGGSAVDFWKELFGEETAERMILDNIYCVRNNE